MRYWGAGCADAGSIADRIFARFVERAPKVIQLYTRRCAPWRGRTVSRQASLEYQIQTRHQTKHTRQISLYAFQPPSEVRSRSVSHTARSARSAARRPASVRFKRRSAISSTAASVRRSYRPAASYLCTVISLHIVGRRRKGATSPGVRDLATAHCLSRVPQRSMIRPAIVGHDP